MRGGRPVLSNPVEGYVAQTSVATVQRWKLWRFITVSTLVSGCALDAPTQLDEPVPTSIVLLPNTLAFESLTDTSRLTATAYDATGSPIPNAVVSWSSSDRTVADVDRTGLVTARANGLAAIAASAGSITTEARVTVRQVPDSIVVLPEVLELTSLGEAVQLTVTVLDRRGQTVEDATVEWQASDPSVVTVAQNGFVLAVRNGKTTVTASADNALAEVRVTVGQVAISLQLESPGRALIVGNSFQLAVAAVDARGKAIDDVAAIWSSADEAVAAVDETGLVRAVGVGTAVIRANTQSASDSVEVEVIADEERTILSDLWDATNGHGWLNDENWVTDAPLSGWYGVALDTLGYVTELTLPSNRLSGTLPEAISDLRYLERLDLKDNLLSGDLPDRLGQLIRLRSLLLHRNDLAGALPPSLEDVETIDTITWDRSEVCVPGTSGFRNWVSSVPDVRNLVAHHYCDQGDRETLAMLYGNTGGSDWNLHTDWLDEGALEHWFGVDTDSIGRVLRLNLTDNGLAGRFPAVISRLERLRGLWIGGNALSGRLPPSLVLLDLEDLHFANTSLCIPMEEAFQRWMADVPSVSGTGRDCPPLTDTDVLRMMYMATGGSNWTRNDNWLSDLPLDRWYGVTTWADGSVQGLDLRGRGLRGRIPHEFSQLQRLARLDLGGNQLNGPFPEAISHLGNLRGLKMDNSGLTGRIPASVGQLTSLDTLWLANNGLVGPIHRELGELARLEDLWLSGNALTGPVPAEIGNLARLTRLRLHGNRLTGLLPPELGRLGSLRELTLWSNQLTGSLPPEFGGLRSLESLVVEDNQLEGSLPPELGRLSSLVEFDFRRNRLSGGLPAEFSNLSSLERLWGSRNPEMSGALPAPLTRLSRLRFLVLSETQLCVPRQAAFDQWLDRIPRSYVGRCRAEAGTPFYLTQAIQSLIHQIPLIAGDDALLRIFVTSERAHGARTPPVRATFFRDGSPVHVAETRAGPGRIPISIQEMVLDSSVNVDVPGWVLKPGVEVVIEVDPDESMDASLGVKERIPATGSAKLDIRSVPALDLTIVPFVWTEDPSKHSKVSNLTVEHPLLWATRELLPVGDINLTVHEPVFTKVDPTFANAYTLLAETAALRVAEGGAGHYLGLLRGSGGLAQLQGRNSVAGASSFTIAHELGHNMSLQHANCGIIANVDKSYPHESAAIGVWGYDRKTGREIPPSATDLMSYCEEWISDYSFMRALKYRGWSATGPTLGPTVASLLLWGGVNENGKLILEPSFVIDAPVSLPEGAGPHRLTGRTESGDVLFAFDFRMMDVADGQDGARSFAFAIPAHDSWATSLYSVTLDGPEGSVSIGREAAPATALLQDEVTGRVMGFVRGWTDSESLPSPSPVSGRVKAQVSSGVPKRDEWKR